jgi:hypothetical protein
MEQIFVYVGAIGGLAGIAAILTVFANYFKHKRENHLEALQIQAMQIGFDSQLKALTESVTSWKGFTDTNGKLVEFTVKTSFENNPNVLYPVHFMPIPTP